MLTTKDFVLIADVIKRTKPIKPHTATGPEWMISAARTGQWEDTVETFADVCAASNPAFKRHLFLRACGREDV